MSAQSIRIGMKRTATFNVVDQYGNLNPVGSNGQPLRPIGVPVWTLESAGSQIQRPTPYETASGFVLTPSADGASCEVAAEVVGMIQLLAVTADRGDGVMVSGSVWVESVPQTGGATSVIASLTVQLGPETPYTPAAKPAPKK